MTPQLTRFPMPASEEDYARASAELEGRLRELPGAVALYRMGSVSALGISDLDRVAVVEPGARVPEVWPTLSDETRALAMHGPFLVDTTTFASHRLFVDLEPLELVAGDAVEVRPRPAAEHLELLIAAEGLVVTTLRLVKQAAVGRVKVRPALCELHNVRHDLRLARLTPADAPEAWSFVERVRRLREEWWTLADAERAPRFRRLLDSAFAASADALRALAARCPSDGHDGRPLRLSGAWKNVRLTAGEPQASWPSTGPTAVVRPRRVGESLWQRLPHELRIGAPVLALLQRSPGREEVRAQRRDVVARYAEFLAGTTTYSAIGFARAFLQ